jgi:hypothetical protein
MWDDHDMSNADQTSYERTEFEVRWNQRYFAWNMAGIFLFFLVYVAVAVLASDTFRLVGVAGVIVFGVFMVMGGVSRAKQLRRGPVAVALNEFGVSFYQHDPVAWETLREVRFGRVKPRLLYFTHPLYYIAFVPQKPAKPHSLSPRKRMTIRIYGTTRVLITQTVSPSGEDILAAVERLSDVPVRR